MVWYKVGDTVFISGGIPAIVVKINKRTTYVRYLRDGGRSSSYLTPFGERKYAQCKFKGKIYRVPNFCCRKEIDWRKYRKKESGK